MKKIITIILLLVSIPNLYAVGIGPSLNITPGFTAEKPVIQTGAACSIFFENQPLQMNISTDYSIIQQTFETYITIDCFFLNKQISDYSFFYLGAGEIIGASINSDSALTLGARAVTGISWFYLDGFLEYFVQAAVEPTGRFGNKSEFIMNFPVNAGIRLYF